MKTFTYNYIAKLIYKYANIPITILFILYLAIALFAVNYSLLSLLTITVNILVIYFVNRFYFRMYKTTPFKINADDQKMICTEYVLNKRTITVEYKNITSINGWVFSGFTNRPLIIYDDIKKTTVSIYPHLKGYRELLQRIFNGISEELHQEVMKKLSTMQESSGMNRGDGESEKGE